MIGFYFINEICLFLGQDKYGTVLATWFLVHHPVFGGKRGLSY